MKKITAWILALIMALAAPAALADTGMADHNYEELVVGSTTALSGGFFTDMWGSNTSDMDVRMLLHGYNLMEWKAATGAYGIDDSVVSGLVVTDDASGDRSYTIVLYDDMYYSDGTKITAADYAFSILLSTAPEIAAIGGAVSGSEYILGMEEYLSGEESVLEGVRILGEYQLSITVKEEYLPFFYEMALLDYSPYPIHVIAPGCAVADDGDGAYIRGEGFTPEVLAETILDPETGYRSHPSVVSGPYKLVSYDAQAAEAVFEINEYYKGNSAGQLPQIPRIVFKNVSNADMIGQLERGEIDLLNKCVDVNALDAGMQLVSSGAYAVNNYARSGFSFISYNCEQPAMQSAAVRQAIAHCFDKDAFVSSYVRNYGIAVDGYYGIGQWMYQLVEGTLAAPVEAPGDDAGKDEIKAYEEALAAWDKLSLDELRHYALDLAAAEALLVQDGWTLNREGAAFDPEKDDVRCKQVGDMLVALELEMIYPEGNAIGDTLQETFIDHLAQVGIALRAEAKPFAELLNIYYRNVERDCDMIYLASNFDTVFDPSEAFSVADADLGRTNRTGIADEKLYKLAAAMRQTQPGDVLGYCEKWVDFQEYWTEVLPAIPVYSNVYFDFYAAQLQNYNIAENMSWAQAIVGAYLGDVAAAPEAAAPAGDEFVG